MEEFFYIMKKNQFTIIALLLNLLNLAIVRWIR